MSEDKRYVILVEKPRSKPQKFYKIHVSESELQMFWKWWREVKAKRETA